MVALNSFFRLKLLKLLHTRDIIPYISSLYQLQFINCECNKLYYIIIVGQFITAPHIHYVKTVSRDYNVPVFQDHTVSM